jgi:hypothetical protein
MLRPEGKISAKLLIIKHSNFVIQLKKFLVKLLLPTHKGAGSKFLYIRKQSF